MLLRQASVKTTAAAFGVLGLGIGCVCADTIAPRTGADLLIVVAVTTFFVQLGAFIALLSGIAIRPDYCGKVLRQITIALLIACVIEFLSIFVAILLVMASSPDGSATASSTTCWFSAMLWFTVFVGGAIAELAEAVSCSRRGRRGDER
jgi:hypothetical protein